MDKVLEDMPQKKIQDLIERIMRYIQEVIKLEGGNRYKERQMKGQNKTGVH